MFISQTVQRMIKIFQIQQHYICSKFVKVSCALHSLIVQLSGAADMDIHAKGVGPEVYSPAAPSSHKPFIILMFYNKIIPSNNGVLLT